MRLTVTMSALVLLGALGNQSAAAQRWDKPIRRFIDRYYGVEFGLVGTVNRNTVTGAGPVDARFRGSGGGFMSVPITEGLRFRPEAVVSGKQVGRTTTINPPSPCLPSGSCVPVTEQTVHSFTWIELPLLVEARFRRALGGWGTPKLYAGPFLAIRVGCSTFTPAGTPDAKLVQSCKDAQPNLQLNNGDAGFVLGGSIATGPVGLGFRWTRSLVPIAPFGSNAGFLAGAKNSTLAVSLELSTRLR